MRGMSARGLRKLLIKVLRNCKSRFLLLLERRGLDNNQSKYSKKNRLQSLRNLNLLQLITMQIVDQ